MVSFEFFIAIGKAHQVYGYTPLDTAFSKLVSGVKAFSPDPFDGDFICLGSFVVKPLPLLFSKMFLETTTRGPVEVLFRVVTHAYIWILCGNDAL